MKQAKKMLAVLLALAVLCGFAAIGASASEETAVEAVATEQQLKDLRGYMKVVYPMAILERALGRVPGFLKWTAFSKGSSFAAMEADLGAELKKVNLDMDKFIKWEKEGKLDKYSAEAVLYNKVMAEKGPAIVKKHCVFYVDWIVAVID